MQLEDQCLSLELSKKLKELCLIQNSYFVWFKLFEKENFDLAESWQIDDEERFETISAFTASELMEILPRIITLPTDEPFNSFRFRLEKSFISNDGKTFDNSYIVNYRCDSTELTGENSWLERILFGHNLFNKKLVDVLGTLLIHLIENNYMEVKK